MEHGFYAEAKNYILYRWQRTERRKALNHIVNETGDETITDTLKGIGQDFPRNEYSLTLLAEKFSSFYKPEMTPNERLTALIKAAVELTTQEAPDWEFIAARLLNFQLSKKLTEQAEFAGVLSFYEKLTLSHGRRIIRQLYFSLLFTGRNRRSSRIYMSGA